SRVEINIPTSHLVEQGAGRPVGMGKADGAEGGFQTFLKIFFRFLLLWVIYGGARTSLSCHSAASLSPGMTNRRAARRICQPSDLQLMASFFRAPMQHCPTADGQRVGGLIFFVVPRRRQQT